MNPTLSIIIPCYNSAKTAEETFQSIINQDFTDWEAIIVNDGSPDNIEEIALKWVNKDHRFNYFKKENGGLGTARNFGINHAKGKYILPLDSDNKVESTFAKKALPILENNPTVGVLYGDAIYFGDKDEHKVVGDFDSLKLAKTNYIDACAIIRKEVFDKIGLYDVNMPYQGIEDWELWIRITKSNYTFYYLNQPTYYYRITGNSMIRSFNPKMTESNMGYLYVKHFWFFISTFWKNRKIEKKWKTLIIRTLKRTIKRLLFLI